jgi:hypothetical protein
VKADWLLAVLVLLAAATTPGIATSNEPPLADAGLDQTTTRGSTVYLDGGGSRDPDGVVSSYEWTVTTPAGTATTLDCGNCERSQFQATSVGTYEVTLQVTDDDGATATDTLYVTVEPGAPPDASLAGPSRLTTGARGEFTADITAGAAPLERAIWYVDGEQRFTSSLDDSTAAPEHRVRFPTTGTHEVTVVAVDADGQRAEATRTVAVTRPTTPPSSPTGGSSGSSAETDTIDGPRVLTESDDLRGEYVLSGTASGSWHVDGQRVATGDSASLAFTPGRHGLYAVPNGGSSGVATFPDGSRTVVADPAPDVSELDIENGSIVSLDVQATDALGNLESLVISVDGQPVETLTTGNFRNDRTGRSLSTVKRLSSLDPGKHIVTVEARDRRGQIETVVRTVTVPGPPRVVSAGFVQEGPLDQYHPRIHESRYMATYRVVIDLNGVSTDAVKSRVKLTYTGEESEIRRETRSNGDILVIEKNAYNRNLGEIKGKAGIHFISGEPILTDISTIKVTPSPPEIRVSVVTPQADDGPARPGIEFDASNSFDPDQTKLDYDWYGVDGDHTEGPQATLDSFKLAKLELTDSHEQTSSTNGLLRWFAPDLRSAQITNRGPFYPNETVTFSVRSKLFHFSKPTYGDSVSVNLNVDEGRVLRKELLRGRSDEIGAPDAEPSSRQYRWTVAVPARAFVENDEPLIVSSYPTEHPTVEYESPLPEPSVYVLVKTELRDVATSVSYLVERPEYKSRTTANEEYRDTLLENGYDVALVTNSGREYLIEERVKVEEAEYDVERQQFRQRGRRSDFLELHPDWSDAGSRMETRRWTTTEREWRSSRSGSGTFTGETRRKLVERGAYRTQKQFRYEETETYETTETYEDTYTTTETEVVTRERCTAFGCVPYQTTVTETEHHTVTRTRAVTRTRTVEKTYWSEVPRDWSHEYTGRKRQITLREPEYERQYEFEFEKRHSETVYVYLAENRTKVEPAAYEWQIERTVTRRSVAEVEAMAPNTRIGASRPTKEWVLEKQVGTEVVTLDHTKPEWDVLETIGRGEATIVEQYVRHQGKQTFGRHTRERQIEVNLTSRGFLPEESVRNIVIEEMKPNNEE